MEQPIKSGVRTSEFWLSLFSILLTFLAVKGVINVSQINPILNDLSQVYGGAVGMLTILGIVHSYIRSRTLIKNAGTKLPIA